MIDDTTPTGNIAPIPGEAAPAPAPAPRGPSYAGPVAGLPPQTGLTTDTAVLTDAYAVIPRSVMRDIVTSFLPGWTGMRMWIIARPLSGFAETFSQYIVELAEGGGCDAPEDDPEIQSALFVTGGEMDVTSLAGEVELSQSALSQHLAKLREDGLVAFRRESQTIHYRLEDPRAARVLETLKDIFCPELG